MGLQTPHGRGTENNSDFLNAPGVWWQVSPAGRSVHRMRMRTSASSRFPADPDACSHLLKMALGGLINLGELRPGFCHLRRNPRVENGFSWLMKANDHYQIALGHVFA
jgi:hypothetical protein